MRGRSRGAWAGVTLARPSSAGADPRAPEQGEGAVAFEMSYILVLAGGKVAFLPGELLVTALKILTGEAWSNCLGCRYRKKKNQRNWCCHNQDGRWNMSPVQ
jgi:hypothetical protein